MEKINNPEAFVGRKCKGFKFENNNTLGFAPEMNEYIGKVGTIERHYTSVNTYRIRFSDDYWYYPADERIFENLID
jgi:hypothetical protein